MIKILKLQFFFIKFTPINKRDSIKNITILNI